MRLDLDNKFDIINALSIGFSGRSKNSAGDFCDQKLFDKVYLLISEAER